MIDEKLLIKELNLRVRTKRSTMEIIRDIIPLVEMQPKVSEQEIRDKAIERIIERIEEVRQKYQRLCREQGEDEDEVMNIHFRGIVKIIKEEASKNVEDISEEIKEVGE